MARDLWQSARFIPVILTGACVLAAVLPAPLSAQGRGFAVTTGLGITTGHPVGPVRWTVGGEVELWNEARLVASFTSWSVLAECSTSGVGTSACGRNDRSWEVGVSRELGVSRRVRPYLGLTAGQYRDGRSSTTLGLAAGLDVLATAPFAFRVGGRHHELLGAEHPPGLRFTALEVGLAWTRW